MPSAEPGNSLSRDRAHLLDVAEASLDAGIRTGRPFTVDIDEYSQALQARQASFVTLRTAGDLRGCMGSLTALVSLVEDVAKNAFLAGFRDPRFPPLTAAEFAAINISISVLSRPEVLESDSEADLIRRLRPGIDGLILQEAGHRGTLLPSVWTQLPRPVDFLRQLKRKAGLAADYWSPTIQVQRYTAESFHRDKSQASR